MTLDELITELQAIREREGGELPVYLNEEDWEVPINAGSWVVSDNAVDIHMNPLPRGLVI